MSRVCQRRPPRPPPFRYTASAVSSSTGMYPCSINHADTPAGTSSSTTHSGSGAAYQSAGACADTISTSYPSQVGNSLTNTSAYRFTVKVFFAADTRTEEHTSELPELL